MRSSPSFGALLEENSPKSTQNKMGEFGATLAFCMSHVYKITCHARVMRIALQCYVLLRNFACHTAILRVTHVSCKLNLHVFISDESFLT